jgi:O-antigen/teichoic acid export membrane protein
MMGIRRAFLWASVGRYLVMAINLAATLSMARLLSPAEYGVSVLGAAVFAVAEAIRALGGGAYLIQQDQLASANIRTSFSISLIVTLVLTVVLILLVRPLARSFNTPDLEPYLLVAAIGYLTGPFVYPISALMSRNMAFGEIAIIGAVTASVSAIAGICLAVLGFSSMSFAWAGAISSIAAMFLYLYYWRDWSIFRPVLREWRSVIAFGAHDSAAAVLSQIAEALTYLILGRKLDASAVGLCQRAVMLCLFPERVILAGVGAVALPAFSQHMREGQALKHSYLKVIELTTAAQWPSLLLLILLADPIVSILLGPHWQEVAPLMQIFAASLLCSFPFILLYPTLVAHGAIRYLPPVVAVQVVVSIGILAFAAGKGLHAVALSTLLVVPFSCLLSLLLARHFLHFRWVALARAIWRSAVVAAASAVGPLVIIIATDWKTEMPIVVAITAGALSAAGWVGGLWLTRHPLLHEILSAVGVLRHALRR